MLRRRRNWGKYGLTRTLQRLEHVDLRFAPREQRETGRLGLVLPEHRLRLVVHHKRASLYWIHKHAYVSYLVHSASRTLFFASHYPYLYIRMCRDR